MTAGNEISYQSYLDSKYLIDEESLNARVRGRFLRAVSAHTSCRILDVGTGTGAAIRRLISDGGLPPNATIIGIDVNTESLRIASAALGDRARFVYGSILDTELQKHLLSLVDNSPSRGSGFDVVTAHAFMDLVPIDLAISSIRNILVPDGIAYFSLNYDGRTTLVPESSDPGTETAILDEYDRSMDERLLDGMPTGGSRTGTRLFARLEEFGFRIDAMGPSDWCVFCDARQTDTSSGHESVFLAAILQMIYQEMRTRAASGRQVVAARKLDGWYAERMAALRAGHLGLLTHQSDILARKVSNE